MPDKNVLTVGDQFRISSPQCAAMLRMGGITHLVEVLGIIEQPDGSKLITVKSAVTKETE